MSSNPQHSSYFAEEPHSKYDSMKAPAKISVYSEELESEMESGKGNFESDWPLNPSYQKGNSLTTLTRANALTGTVPKTFLVKVRITADRLILSINQPLH